jgi:hypothetical protein
MESIGYFEMVSPPLDLTAAFPGGRPFGAR